MKNRNLDNSNHWETPKEFYDKLNDEFKFNYDPCPLHSKHDALDPNHKWGTRNFVNPPYDKILKPLFVERAIHEKNMGNLCVMLIPVSTSTILFHDHILPNASDIRFVRKRIKFIGYNTKGEFVDSKVGMHDSMVVIFDGTEKVGQKIADIWTKDMVLRGRV